MGSVRVKLRDFTWLPLDQSEFYSPSAPLLRPGTILSVFHRERYLLEQHSRFTLEDALHFGDTWAQKLVSQLTSVSWWSRDLTPGSTEPEPVLCTFRLAWAHCGIATSHFCSRLQHVWEGRVSAGAHGNLWALVVWWHRGSACLSGTLVSHERAGLLNSTSRTLVSLTFLLEHAPPWTISASVLQNLHLLHTLALFHRHHPRYFLRLQLSLLARVRISTELSCGTLAADAPKQPVWGPLFMCQKQLAGF